MAVQTAATVSMLEAIFNPTVMYGDMQAVILSCLDNNDLNVLQLTSRRLNEFMTTPPTGPIATGTAAVQASQMIPRPLR